MMTSKSAVSPPRTRATTSSSESWLARAGTISARSCIAALLNGVGITKKVPGNQVALGGSVGQEVTHHDDREKSRLGANRAQVRARARGIPRRARQVLQPIRELGGVRGPGGQ